MRGYVEAGMNTISHYLPNLEHFYPSQGAFMEATGAAGDGSWGSHWEYTQYQVGDVPLRLNWFGSELVSVQVVLWTAVSSNAIRTSGAESNR